MDTKEIQDTGEQSENRSSTCKRCRVCKTLHLSDYISYSEAEAWVKAFLMA